MSITSPANTEAVSRPYTRREPHPSATRFDQVCDVIRVKHYSLRTEHTYLQWIRRFAGFHRRHPGLLGEAEVRDFLTHLARDLHVTASTQNPCTGTIVGFVFIAVLLSLRFGSGYQFVSAPPLAPPGVGPTPKLSGPPPPTMTGANSPGSAGPLERGVRPQLLE